MATDQATALRRMVAQMSHATTDNTSAAGSPVRATPVLAVTSGKGGVGKTNVAVNLAARLARMSRRVLLVDADLGLANADVICNCGGGANLGHVVAGRRRLSDIMVDGPGGFSLIPGASGLAQMAALSEMDHTRLLHDLKQVESEHDLIIIDTGAGISPNVLSFVEAADEMLLVTTPEPTSITDAYALIKTVSRRREATRVNLLVNMARDREEARRVFDRLNAVCRRFLGLSLHNAGFVPLDPRVGNAVRRRTPFVISDRDCPAAMSITQLAHKLDRHASEPRHRGFFRRVASWLAG
jgi:flagellar biosynthesis protein FlhG